MASQLLLVVRLSNEQARHAVRQNCSIAKKLGYPHALLVVVRSGSRPSLGESAEFMRVALSSRRHLRRICRNGHSGFLGRNIPAKAAFTTARGRGCNRRVLGAG
jgi:hypothetical protein